MALRQIVETAIAATLWFLSRDAISIATVTKPVIHSRQFPNLVALTASAHIGSHGARIRLLAP